MTKSFPKMHAGHLKGMDCFYFDPQNRSITQNGAITEKKFKNLEKNYFTE